MAQLFINHPDTEYKDDDDDRGKMQQLVVHYIIQFHKYIAQQHKTIQILISFTLLSVTKFRGIIFRWLFFVALVFDVILDSDRKYRLSRR